MPCAAVFQEIQIPLQRITALFRRHTVVPHRRCVVEVTIFFVCIQIQPYRDDALSVSIAETRVCMRINAHRAECANDLCRDLAVVIAGRVENVSGLHAHTIRCGFVAENDIQSFVQLLLNSWVFILIGSDCLHQHGNHIKLKFIRTIFMRQKRVQHAFPRPFRIRRNCIIAHIDRIQEKDRTIDRILDRVIIKLLHKVVDVDSFLFCGVYDILSRIRIQLRRVNSKCGEHHNAAVVVRHFCAAEFRSLLLNVKIERQRVTRLTGFMFVEPEVHKLPVRAFACHRRTIARDDFVQKVLHPLNQRLVGLCRLADNRCLIALLLSTLRSNGISHGTFGEVLCYARSWFDRCSRRNNDGWSKLC